MARDTFSPAFVIVRAKDIAQRAYEIFVDRGDPLADWQPRSCPMMR